MYYVTIFLNEDLEYDFMVFECITIELAQIILDNANSYKHTKKATLTSKLLENIKDKKVYHRNIFNSPKWYNVSYLNGFQREE